MDDLQAQPKRRIGRRLSDVPLEVRSLLASGVVETRNWTEWMATDMSALARTVARETTHVSLRSVLLSAADAAEGERILTRLKIFGHAVSDAVHDFRDPAFVEVATHQSDVVRQWGAYAVNDDARKITLLQRLKLTLPFAADEHWSVRECAWMAYRPYLSAQLIDGICLLEPISRSSAANLRRFAIEVSRPRSVWGSHIAALKRDPQGAIVLLESVNQDDSRCVRLSAGNWLNDASKSRPDWVRELCKRWSKIDSKHTQAIISRGLRTLARQDKPRLAGATP